MKDYVPIKIRKLEQRLEENEYDMEAWNSLIRDAQVFYVLCIPVTLV